MPLEKEKNTQKYHKETSKERSDRINDFVQKIKDSKANDEIVKHVDDEKEHIINRRVSNDQSLSSIRNDFKQYNKVLKQELGEDKQNVVFQKGKDNYSRFGLPKSYDEEFKKNPKIKAKDAKEIVDSKNSSKVVSQVKGDSFKHQKENIETNSDKTNKEKESFNKRKFEKVEQDARNYKNEKGKEHAKEENKIKNEADPLGRKSSNESRKEKTVNPEKKLETNNSELKNKMGEWWEQTKRAAMRTTIGKAGYAMGYLAVKAAKKVSDKVKDVAEKVKDKFGIEKDNKKKANEQELNGDRQSENRTSNKKESTKSYDSGRSQDQRQERSTTGKNQEQSSGNEKPKEKVYSASAKFQNMKIKAKSNEKEVEM
ncbi:hypothetical protein [Chondrinema litorale]|uniref:hypothetical protein n=1 Tax=Chondrinema litorale TaxID=2994555 RepID=UPI002543411F|nr:hypothetical protein [Chondrinema litorale]UZS00083.1 hypothetical protein OQ292_39780 [Chondrinema litorale]